jgi:Flp pilus assembly secretin CpaC
MMLVAVGSVPAAWGQDAESDRAQQLLKKGIQEYKAKNFQQCQQTLLQADREKLSDTERKDLDDYLGKVRGAVKQQAAAMAAYKQAQAAMKADELDKAVALFEKVAASGFVTDAVSRQARQQRALALKKILAAKAAAAQAATTTRPAPKPAAEPTTKPAPTAPGLGQVRLQELQTRIAKAKRYVQLGYDALDNNDVEAALKHLNDAVEVAPEYEAARIALAQAQNLAGKARGQQAINELERIMQIRKQRTEMRYAQAMLRAREALQVVKAREDFARAREEANYAKTLVTTNKILFGDAEYRRKLDETENLLKFIDTEQNRWDQQRVRQQRDEIEMREKQRKEEALRQRMEKISVLKARVQALRKEHKYVQAVEILGRIRELDAKDAWAAEMYETLSRFVLLLEDKEAARLMYEEEAKQYVGIRDAQIPWYQLLRYPNDWPEIRESRKKYEIGEAEDSPANRAVRKKLRQTHRKFEFTGVPLEQVMDFMQVLSGCNIHVRWNALEAVGVNRDIPVNVKLTDVTIRKALRTILEDVGGANPLGFVIDEGVVTISTKDDLARDTVTRVYDIRDLIVRVPMFEGPEVDLQGTGNMGGNNTGGGTSGGLFGNVSGNNDTGNDGEENEISRQELIDNILELIQAVVGPGTWSQTGEPGTGSIRELSGQIVVSQTPENHEELVRLLGQLREARELLINVEARFIQVSTGFLNHIGIDLDFYFNLSTRLKPTGTTDPLTGASLVDTSAGALLPQWQNRGFITDRFTPFGFRQGSFDFAGPQQTQVPGSIGGTATSSALSIAGTFLDDIQVDFLISATQANQNTRTLIAPRLTLWNGQRAYVTVATQQAYVQAVEPEVTENVAALRPVIGTVSTGTTLDVEATVTADRKYVNMTIRPWVSTINGFTEYQGLVDTEGNPIEGSGLLQLPNVTVQEVRCTVSVPDGGTLLLGGQRLAGEVEREMGVPILSKIPVLNRAFTNRSMVRDEQTLLIMVKPKIIIHKEYEEAAFPE